MAVQRDQSRYIPRNASALCIYAVLGMGCVARRERDPGNPQHPDTRTVAMRPPPLTEGAYESVQAYVLRRLVDANEALTSEQLAAGRPDYISEKSPGVAASQLYARGGILGRLRDASHRAGGRCYAYYMLDGGLERLPKDFSWEGHPERSHAGQRPRTGLSKPRHYNGDDGVLAPPSDPDPARQEPAMVSDPEPPAPTPSEMPPPPRPVGPGIVLVTSKGPKHFSFADAREIYRQLQELFG